MPLTADDIARQAHGDVAVGDAAARVTSWAFDSRALRPGACFVALHGGRDGHDFVPAAFESGAHVALVERVPSLTLPQGRAVVRVDDPLTALQALARQAREARPGMEVVAVAGSTGKTSTKDLLAAVLAPLGCDANEESFNNEFGLPITLLNAPEAARVVITEMGERRPRDLEKLCEIARPDVGVVTNVGLAHAEFLGGQEGVAAVLLELLTALPASGTAVLNADDPWTPKLAAKCAARVVTVGRAAGADYVVDDIVLDDRLRPSFALRGPRGPRSRRPAAHRFQVPLHGEHHVANAAMAVVVASDVFGLPFDEVEAALAGARRGRWRMELIETPAGVTLLNDAYNANPASMEAALHALARLPVTGRRVAILGDMRELGVHAADAHAGIGRLAGDLGIDSVIGVGDGGAAIAGAARAAGVAEVQSVADADAALVAARALVAPGDGVLVKASRALALERVADALAAEEQPS